MRPCLKTNKATIQQCTSPGLGCVTASHKCLWVSHKWRRRLGGLPRRGNSCGQFLAVPFCLLCFPVNPLDEQWGLTLLCWLGAVTLPQCQTTSLWKSSLYFLIHQALATVSGLFLEMISVISWMLYSHTLTITLVCPCVCPYPPSPGCHGHCVLLLPTLSFTPSLTGSSSFLATLSHLHDRCAHLPPSSVF